MSSHWTVFCVTCDTYGPDIRRSATVSLVGRMPRYHPDVRGVGGRGDASEEWLSFMNEHEWCELRLVHE